MNFGKTTTIIIGRLKYRFNLDQCFLFVFLMFNIHVFYLLPSNSITRSLTFIWSLMWLCSTVLRSFSLISVLRKFSFPSLFLILIFIAAFQGYKIYGQPILMGLSPQRISAADIMVLFPLLVALNKHTLNYTKIMSVVRLIVLIESLFCVIQFFLGTKFDLLYVHMYIHNGRMRIYADIVLMQFVYFDILNSILQKKINRKKGSLILLSIFTYIYLVAQHRSSILILLSITVAAIFIWKKINITKIVIICLTMFAAFAFLNSVYFSKIMDAIINNTGTFMVRSNARTFYLEQLKNNWLLGCGYSNANWLNAYIYSGMSEGYLLADNGIYGYIFSYGWLGMVWYFIFMIMLFRSGIRKYQRDGNIVLILIFLFFVLGNLTFSWFFEIDMICVPMTFCIIYAYKSDKYCKL